MLAAGAAVDGILGASRGGAAPVPRPARRAGRSVPEEFSVAGVDDAPAALDPPLNSLRPPSLVVCDSTAVQADGAGHAEGRMMTATNTAPRTGR